MAFDTCQMPSKIGFCVQSLTQIAWNNGKRPFMPGAANDRKEPIFPYAALGSKVCYVSKNACFTQRNPALCARQQG